MAHYTGKIASGSGKAEKKIENRLKALFNATGLHFYAGSLNVFIDKPIVCSKPGLCYRAGPKENWLIPVKINGQSAFIHRPQKYYAGQDLRLIHLISTMHLKSQLGVSCGDEVRIEIDDFYHRKAKPHDLIALSLVKARQLAKKSIRVFRELGYGRQTKGYSLVSTARLWVKKPSPQTMAVEVSRNQLRLMSAELVNNNYNNVMDKYISAVKEQPGYGLEQAMAMVEEADILAVSQGRELRFNLIVALITAYEYSKLTGKPAYSQFDVIWRVTQEIIPSDL